MAYSNNGSGNRGPRSYGGGGGGGGYNSGYDRGGDRDSSVMIQDDTIFVSGMSAEVSEADIADHFGAIGIIKKDKRTQKPKIWIYKDKQTGGSKGECTITYDDAHTATSAIEWFDGKEFNGSVVKVQLAQRNSSASWQQKGGPGGGKKFGSGGMGGGQGPRSFGGASSHNQSEPRRGGGSGGSAGVGQSREGDWVCSDCSNKNFAWRNECNRCKNPRSDSGNSSSVPRNMSSQRDRGDGGGNYRGNFNQGPMRGSGPSGGNRQRPY